MSSDRAGDPAPFTVWPVPGVNELDEPLIQQLYGRWLPMSPVEVAALFDGAPFPWWIAGGLAIEAAAGAPRRHWDTDVVVLKRDLEAMRDWLAEFHLWEVEGGTLRPLLRRDRMSSDRDQLWMRRDASSPWLLDLLLSPAEGHEWLYKRDHSVHRPLDDIGHRIGGVPYLRPSIVLLFKAKAHRPQDEADLSSVLPRLSQDERGWLAGALHKEQPDHPWLAVLD
ncbi:MAG TPA: hypothetical protein VHV50_04290 [Actinomycetota bacterium]|nr:hypothetical protein [Actinomycetota bacterium]